LDLSFPGFDRSSEVSRLPRDLSAAVADVAARQHLSPALRSEARAGRAGHRSRRLHPLDCAFNGAVAMLLRALNGGGQENEDGIYRGVSADLQDHADRDSNAFREGAPRPDRG
jgi:hypothetical protein